MCEDRNSQGTARAEVECTENESVNEIFTHARDPLVKMRKSEQRTCQYQSDSPAVPRKAGQTGDTVHYVTPENQLFPEREERPRKCERNEQPFHISCHAVEAGQIRHLTCDSNKKGLSAKDFQEFDANTGRNAECESFAPVPKNAQSNIAPAEPSETQRYPCQQKQVRNLVQK